MIFESEQQDVIHNEQKMSQAEVWSEFNNTNCIGKLIEGRYKIKEEVYSDEDVIIFKCKDIDDEVNVQLRVYSSESDIDALLSSANHIAQSRLLENTVYRNFAEPIPQFINGFVVTEEVDYSIIIGTQHSEKMVKFFFSKMLDWTEAIHQSGLWGLQADSNTFVLDKFWLDKDLFNSLKFIGIDNLKANDSEAQIAKRNEFNDIYNLGVLLFMLITGSKPFHQKSMKDLLYNLIVTDPDKFIQFHPYLQQIHNQNRISPNLLQLVLKLLRLTEDDYDSYMTIKDIREHAWMQATSIPYEYFLKLALESFW